MENMVLDRSNIMDSQLMYDAVILVVTLLLWGCIAFLIYKLIKYLKKKRRNAK